MPPSLHPLPRTAFQPANQARKTAPPHPPLITASARGSTYLSIPRATSGSPRRLAMWNTGRYASKGRILRFSHSVASASLASAWSRTSPGSEAPGVRPSATYSSSADWNCRSTCERVAERCTPTVSSQYCSRQCKGRLQGRGPKMGEERRLLRSPRGVLYRR